MLWNTPSGCALRVALIPAIVLSNCTPLSSKLVKNAKLIVYEGSPHGLCTTEKDRVNADLLAFIKG